jgi:hypothetical protein
MSVLAFHVIAPDFLFQRNLKMLKFMHNRRPASELSLYGQGPLIKRLHSVSDEAHNFVGVDALSSLAPDDRAVWPNFM